MERGQRENREDGVNPELRKYIRVQIVGMSVFLSWPVAMMLATMYGLDYIIPQISVVILAIAVIILCIGLVGRQELKERSTKAK